MDAEIKAKWVAALRSGDWNQGMLALRTDEDKFCCLGVLADLMRPDEWSPGHPGFFANGGSDSCLPESLRGEVGLSVGAQGKLMRMNDEGVPFAEIADWIEEHL